MVSLVDANGETLWWDSGFEYSENSTAMISGAYNFNETDNLCAEAARKVCKVAMEDLSKNWRR